MAFHIVGYSLQVTASMKQPDAAGLVLEVRKDIKNFLLHLPLDNTLTITVEFNILASVIQDTRADWSG